MRNSTRQIGDCRKVWRGLPCVFINDAGEESETEILCLRGFKEQLFELKI
jgi:hypothetical protein